MAMVKFAMICDHCGARSPEYEAWPNCDNCMEDVCPRCAAVVTEDEGRKRAICHGCWADEVTDSVEGLP